MYDNRLKTFKIVAEQGSFTAASKILFISPVAIMKQIDSFEKLVGAKLFERTPQGANLTKAGEIILEESAEIIHKCDEIMAHARLCVRDHTVISIGYTFTEKDEIVKEFWGGFMDQYPEYRVRIEKKEVTWTGFGELYNQLGKQIDCIHVVEPPDKIRKGVSFEQFGEYDVYALVQRKSKLAQKAILDLSDLEGKTVRLPMSDEKRFVEKMKELGVPVQIRLEGDDKCLERFAISGSNDEFMIDYAADVLGYPSLVAIPVNWDYKFSFGLLYPKKASPVFKHFLLCVKQYMNHRNAH